MAIITPTVFADAVNEQMNFSLRVGKIATDYTDLVEEITAYGDKVNFPEIGRIGDAEDMTKGTALVPKDVNMKDCIATVKQAGNAVRLYDKDSVQVKGKLKENLAVQLGESIAKKIDGDLVKAILTEAVYKNDVPTGGLTLAQIEGAFDMFGDRQDDASMAGIIVNSKLRSSLKAMPQFVDSNLTFTKEGNGAVKDGIIGYWNGSIPVVLCDNGTWDNAKKVASMAIVKKGALGYVVQKECNVEEEREAKLKATDLVADELYATKLVHTDGVAVINVTLS